MTRLISALLATLLLLACTQEIAAPASFEHAANDAIKRKYRCDSVVDATAGAQPLKALVFQQGSDEYTVQWFERSGSTWSRIGPEFDLSGYERPAMKGEPAVLTTRHIASGDHFSFQTTADGRMDLVPDEGAWRRVR